METITLPYKQDKHGNDIVAIVNWTSTNTSTKRPIAVVYHAGGLVMGSAETVPIVQVEYLCSKGFVVVRANYRLVPQVTGKQAFQDAEDAFDWTLSTLPSALRSNHHLELDTSRVVAMGHSSGGTMVLHITSIGKPVRAVTSLYPFLFVSDKSTAAHKPSNFIAGGVAAPSEDDWSVIAPAHQDVSGTPFVVDESPRSRWIKHIFGSGKWMSSIQPDGEFIAIDPMARAHADWAPVMLIHGSEDNVPGRSVELIERAGKELKGAGVKVVEVHVVHNGQHVFDHDPAVGTTAFDHRWDAVKKGMDWLIDHC